MTNETAVLTSIPIAIFSFSTAFLILLFNIIVFHTLKVCENDLSASTALLMRCQLVGNCIGMTSILSFHKVWFTGNHFSEHPFLNGLPGAIGAIGIYAQSCLLLLMAANRYVTFCHFEKAEIWFDLSRTKIYSGVCFFYGFLHFVTSLLPCCRLVVSPKNFKFVHVGAGKFIKLKQLAIVVNDGVILPLVIVCYSLTLRKVREIRKTSTTAQLKQNNFQREKRIMSQFVIVASAWVLHSTVIRSQYFILWLEDNAIWVASCTVLRFMIFLIDPLVCCCFMKKLRKAIKQKLLFWRSNTVGPTEAGQ